MMKRFLFGLCMVLLTASFASAQTVIPAGDVSGTWNAAGSPYQIQGEITVPDGQNLTIEEDVDVEFQGYYKMIVNGVLEATGTEDNMINFYATDPVTGWNGIRFFNQTTASTVHYCFFTDGNSTVGGPIDRRGGAIYCDNSAPVITRCVFWGNSASWGGAIYSWYGVINIENCSFYDNTAGDNGAVTYVGAGTQPVVKNSIFWGNTGAAQLSNTMATSYCDVQGGLAGFGNIDEDPLWVDPDNGDFHLQVGSPCVDAGDPTSPYDPDGSIADMGVFYLHHDPLAIPQNLTADLDSVTGDVTLTWDSVEGGGGAIEELIYDNGIPNKFWYYTNATMACRMSPAYPCDVLTLKIFTSGATDFNAEVYEWLGSQPGTTALLSQNTMANNDDWTEVDVSSAGLSFTSDFMVGFGWTNDYVALGTDTLDNNNRSWDFASGSWSMWNQQYLIRAIVEYPGGEIAELLPAPVIQEAPAEIPVPKEKVMIIPSHSYQIDNTDDFIEYIVYRNGYDRGHTTDTTYVDNLPGPSTFTFTVSALYDEGESFQSDPVEVTWYGVPGVENEGAADLPTEFALYTAHPNPFNPTTTISYELPALSYVELTVYDVSGREVAQLVDGWREVGSHEVTFDASDLSSGVYMYRMTAGEFTASGKMVLTK